MELPDDLFAQLRNEEIEAKVKEALVMELLREHRLSQEKASEILGLDRHELLNLMAKYQVPVIDLTAEELKSELQKSVQHP